MSVTVVASNDPQFEEVLRKSVIDFIRNVEKEKLMNNVEASRILQPGHHAYWQVKPVSIINID